LSETTDVGGAADVFLSVLKNIWDWVERVTSAVWSGLEWPHAVLIIFLVAIFCYRLEFKALIERILEIGPSGLKLQPPASQPSQPDGVEPRAVVDGSIPVAGELPPAPTNKGIPLPPTIVFPEQMRLNKEGILHEVAEMSDTEAKSYLITMLAFCRAMWSFEFCYANIFGGQIRLLQMLNQRIGRSIHMQEVNTIWATHQEQVKPVLDLWSAEQYLSYLSQNGLVEISADTVKLTIKGAEFVLWLTHFGRPLEKPW